MDDRFAMKRLGRKSGFRWLAVLVSVGLLLSGLAKSSEPNPAAVAFGSFPQAWGARISPDGKRIVFLSMHESDLPIALVYDIDKKAVNLVAASQKDEFELKSCVWANSNRLLCSFYSIHQARSFPVPSDPACGGECGRNPNEGSPAEQARERAPCGSVPGQDHRSFAR